jgi:hypothetical protein
MFTTVLPWGKYSYTRMPLGYTGASDVFQHRMDQILGDLPFCACCINDIAIWTKGSFELHLQQLSTALDRLVDANARLNLLKCAFLTEKLKYPGFIFTKKGIRADPMKVEAISRIVPPSKKKQLRGFLGMANYLRSHTPRCSHHSAVLTDLLKGGKTTKFVWTERQQSIVRSNQGTTCPLGPIKFFRLQKGVLYLYGCLQLPNGLCDLVEEGRRDLEWYNCLLLQQAALRCSKKVHYYGTGTLKHRRGSENFQNNASGASNNYLHRPQEPLPSTSSPRTELPVGDSTLNNTVPD